MNLWAVTVDISEAATKYAYPIVRHQFIGRTLAEAEGYYRAHLQTDAFLRGCVEKEAWQGVKCRARISVGRVVLSDR